MNRTILLATSLACAAAVSHSAPARAGDPINGRIIAARCAACHGPTGVPDNPMIPKLAGQNGYYLYEQLLRFKAGVRMSPIMSPVAETLTSSEMNDVATYFAGLPNGPAAPVPVNAAPVNAAPGGALPPSPGEQGGNH